MFALFEAGLKQNHTEPNPMLRRFAPCMGLTMWHLFEVLIGLYKVYNKNYE